MIRTIIALALLFSTAASAGPEAFDADRLARADLAIQAEIEAGKIPGAVALVLHKGDTAYFKSFGYADIDEQRPMTNEAIFRIASMTKAVTSVAVMQLVEQDRIRLTDPISKFLPAFAEPQVLELNDEGQVSGTRPAAREITIEDLMIHTSGITYLFYETPLKSIYEEAGVISGMTGKDYVLADVIYQLAGLPLLHDPGERFTYGLNTDVLGHLVEVVSGLPLDQYFQQHIFSPLDMNDTAFYFRDSRAERLVTLYAWTDDNGLVESQGDEDALRLDTPNYPVEGAMSYFSGGGGLSSTTMDYGRFCQMLLNGGALEGKRILSRKAVELLSAPRFDGRGDGRRDIALSFYVNGPAGTLTELGTEGAYGWGGAFFTDYIIDPNEELVIVFMSQLRPADSGIAKRFRTLVYHALN